MITYATSFKILVIFLFFFGRAMDPETLKITENARKLVAIVILLILKNIFGRPQGFLLYTITSHFFGFSTTENSLYRYCRAFFLNNFFLAGSKNKAGFGSAKVNADPQPWIF